MGNYNIQLVFFIIRTFIRITRFNKYVFKRDNKGIYSLGQVFQNINKTEFVYLGNNKFISFKNLKKIS